jgi:DNA polymerase
MFEKLKKEISNCKKCRLWKTRNKVVFGEGNQRAKVMLIGEAGGTTEDLLGRPFVGPSGQFLDRCMKKVGIKREKLYITNVVKCRPPNDRRPKKDEIKACLPYLQQEIKAIRPKTICLLGSTAVTTLLGKKYSVKNKATRVKNILFVPMPHPASARRFPKMAKIFIEKIQVLKKCLQ